MDTGGKAKGRICAYNLGCILLLLAQPMPLRTGSFRRATTMPSRLASARSGSLHRHQIPTHAVLSEMQSRQTETFAQDLSSVDSTVVC